MFLCLTEQPNHRLGAILQSVCVHASSSEEASQYIFMNNGGTHIIKLSLRREARRGGSLPNLHPDEWEMLHVLPKLTLQF